MGLEIVASLAFSTQLASSVGNCKPISNSLVNCQAETLNVNPCALGFPVHGYVDENEGEKGVLFASDGKKRCYLTPFRLTLDPVIVLTDTKSVSGELTQARGYLRIRDKINKGE